MPSDELDALLGDESPESRGLFGQKKRSSLNTQSLSYGGTDTELKALDVSPPRTPGGGRSRLPDFSNMIRSIHHTIGEGGEEEVQILTEVGSPALPGVHHHGPNCGHMAIEHGDHIGFLVDGVMQCYERGEYQLDNLCFDCEASIADLHDCCTSNTLPDQPCHIYANVIPCGPELIGLRRATSSCSIHDVIPSPKSSNAGAGGGLGAIPPLSLSPSHDHGPNCGHMAIAHGDHFDYIAINEQDQLELHHMELLPDGSKKVVKKGVLDSVPDAVCGLLGESKGGRGPKAAPWRFRINMANLFGPGSDATSIRVTRLRVASMCCDLEVRGRAC